MHSKLRKCQLAQALLCIEITPEVTEVEEGVELVEENDSIQSLALPNGGGNELPPADTTNCVLQEGANHIGVISGLFDYLEDS